MDPTLAAAIVITVLAVLGVGGAAYALFNPQRTASDRIAELTGGTQQESGSVTGGVRVAATRLQTIAQGAARLAVSDEEQLAALRKRLL